jgi:predicted NBD/HSP70 family sugar kinase
MHTLGFRTSGPAILRGLNRSQVLRAIWQHPGLSRSDLAGELGLAKSTVSAAVNELLEERFLMEEGSTSYSIGRPNKALYLNTEHHMVAAWEISADEVGFAEARVLDLLGNTRQVRHWLLGKRSAEAVIADLAEATVQMQKDLGLPTLQSLCLTLPAIVEANNLLYVAPNLGWRNLELLPLLERAFTQTKLQIVHPPQIANDANAAALGAYSRLQGQIRNFVYLHIGVGLGGGLILNGQLYGGSQGFAGEVGHILLGSSTQPLDGGPLCRCGKQGCAEAYLSYKRWQANPGPELLGEMGEKLALLLGHIVNGFDPEVVMLGGPLIEETGEGLLEEALRHLPKYSLEFSTRTTRVMLSPIGKDAVIRGAGAMAIRQFFEQQGSLAR